MATSKKAIKFHTFLQIFNSNTILISQHLRKLSYSNTFPNAINKLANSNALAVFINDPMKFYQKMVQNDTVHYMMHFGFSGNLSKGQCRGAHCADTYHMPC